MGWSDVRISRGLYGAGLVAAGLGLALSGVLPAQAAAGARWSLSDVITPAKGTNWLYGAVATSKSDAWSAGVSDGATKSTVLVMHYNGHSWRQVPVPASLRSVTAAAQVSVAASSASNAWVFELQPGRSQRILRWDGHRWHLMLAPSWIYRGNPAFPNDQPGSGAVAVFGRSSAWVFSVGTNEQPSEAARDVGGHWRLVQLPGIPGSVDAVSADDIWAYGVSNGESILMHWNGTAWATHPGTSSLQGTIVGASWNDAWILTSGSLAHWNGRSLTTIALPSGLGPYRIATDGRGGVWMWGPHQVGALITTPDVFLHYGNGAFSQHQAPAPKGNPVEVAAMAPIPGTTALWAVGWVSITTATSGAIMGYQI
jgi:hypothetical protein